MEHNSLSSSDKAKCSKHQLLNFFTFTNSHCQVSRVNLVLFVTPINLFQLCDSFEYDQKKTTAKTKTILKAF